MTITAKGLARSINRREHWVRVILRKNFKRGRGTRWEWTDREGEKVKAWFVRYLNGGRPK
jgi:hypothetical protein